MPGKWDIDGEDLHDYLMNVEPLYVASLRVRGLKRRAEDLADETIEAYKAACPGHTVVKMARQELIELLLEEEEEE